MRSMFYKLKTMWLVVALTLIYCDSTVPLPLENSAAQNSSDPLDFTDCGSLYFVDNLKIEGCRSDSECRLYIGRNKSIAFDVITATKTTELASDVYLYARGMKWQLTVNPESPCDVIRCPVTESRINMYSATIYVDNTFLQLRGDLYWVLHGDQSLQLVCFSTPVVIVFDPEADKLEEDQSSDKWFNSQGRR